MDENSLRVARKTYDIALAAADAASELTDRERAEALIEFLKNGGAQSETSHGVANEISEMFARAVVEKKRRALIKF